MKMWAVILALLVFYAMGIVVGSYAKDTPGTVSVAQLKQEQKDKTKLPDIPEGYQSKFQAIVIREQKINLQLTQIIQQYQQAQQDLLKVNTEGQDLEKKMLKEMGLDPSQYSTQVSDSGVLVVIHQPHQDKK